MIAGFLFRGAEEGERDTFRLYNLEVQKEKSKSLLCLLLPKNAFNVSVKAYPARWGMEVALGVLRLPSPQLVCRLQRCSLGMGLVVRPAEQTWAAQEDAV